MVGFEYRVGDFENPTEIISVPVGFETDFMSIPRFLRPLLDTGRGAKAAIVHDYLLRTGRPYRDADRIFLEGMEVLDIPLLERYFIYGAVSASNWLKDLMGREITG